MISAILASTSSGGIGNHGTLPWPKHKEDLAWFKNHTYGNIVVMGRKTWDDPMMPKPLPNRINVVATSRPLLDPLSARRIQGDIVSHILALEKQFPEKEIFIIGGKELFESCKDIIKKIYLTRIKGDWYADTRINLENWLHCFRIRSVRPGTECTYEIWKREFF